MKVLLFLWLFSCMLVPVYAQITGNISGKAINQQTHEPVQYTNIGIVGRDVGTTSDAAGTFHLPLADKYDRDTFKISMIGYYPLVLTVAELKKTYRSNGMLQLKPKEEALAEVTIRPRRYKHKRLGNTANNKFIVGGFTTYEIGAIMNIHKTPTFIDSVQINVAQSDYDTVFLRINVYEIMDSNNYMNILPEPVYVKMSREEALQDIRVDLSRYNLAVHHDFMIAAEQVQKVDNKVLYLCGAVMGSPSYLRKTSQGNWHKAPTGVGISAFVTY